MSFLPFPYRCSQHTPYVLRISSCSPRVCLPLPSPDGKSKDCLASKGCSTLSALVDLRSAHSLPETRRGKKNRDSEAGQSQSEVWSGPSGRLCTPPGHRRQSSPFSVCGRPPRRRRPSLLLAFPPPPSLPHPVLLLFVIFVRCSDNPPCWCAVLLSP